MELGQHENCAQAVAAARLLYATRQRVLELLA
jgi:hypothetical protein